MVVILVCPPFLGVIGADVSGYQLPCENQPITSRLALICGTSSCHMAVSLELIEIVLLRVCVKLKACVAKYSRGG